MLTVLFLLAAAVLAGSFFRPPQNFWQRAVVALAGILLLAVLAAWSIEWIMQTPT